MGPFLALGEWCSDPDTTRSPPGFKGFNCDASWLMFENMEPSESAQEARTLPLLDHFVLLEPQASRLRHSIEIFGGNTSRPTSISGSGMP